MSRRRDEKTGGDGGSVEPEYLSQLEATIRDAGCYVVPSDDLRPRVIEAARERIGSRRIQRRLLGCVFTLMAVWGLCIPIQDDIDYLRTRWSSPSAAEMHRRAFQIKVKSELGPSWALADAFAQLRHSQAQVLGRMIPGR